MGAQSYAKAGADATNKAIETYASGRMERAQMKATQAENERLNKMQWTAMGNRINTVNLQRGLLRQQTGTDLLNIQKESNRAASASVNNAAAAGIEGASVNDAVQDIRRQNQEATANTKINEQIQEINLDTQIQDIISSAVNAQRYSQKPTSEGEIIGRTIGTSSMEFVSSLAGSSFDYMPTSGTQWTQGQNGSQVNSSYDAEKATDPNSSTNSFDEDANNRYVGYNGGQFGYSSTGNSTYDTTSTGTSGGYNFSDFTSLFNNGR